MKEQGLGSRRQGAGIGAAGVSRRRWIGMVRRCAAIDCGRLVVKGTPYCEECVENLTELREIYAMHDGRESRARMAFFHAWGAVRRGLWIPLTAFVIVALMVMGSAWAPAVVEWIEGGSF